MRLIIKCNNQFNPENVFGKDVLFTAETAGGKADAFIFRIHGKDGVIEEREINSERFLPQRADCSALSPDCVYFWSVTSFYRGRKNGYARAKFRTAFLPEKAEWIGAPEVYRGVTEVRKSFNLKEKPLSARLFICGLGVFESSVNGKKTDEQYFKPLFTDYEQRDLSKNSSIPKNDFHRVGAYVFDCGKLLKKGENVLAVLLGDGYYKNEDKPEEPFVSFGERKLIFELKITYKNGEERVFSGGSEQVRETNLRSELFNGDCFDFSRSSGKPVRAVKAIPVRGEFFFSSVPADTVCKTISPAAIIKAKDGIIYDFGFNLSGGLFFNAKGERGRKIVLEFAETLNEDGSLNTKTSEWKDYNAAKRKEHIISQRAEYVLSGRTDKIAPLFCWRCFRFVKIVGAENAKISAVKAAFIHTDVKEDGKFDCSEPVFNRIYEAAKLTFYDNLHCGVLSDCPHREKRPYTGDGQIVVGAMTDTFDIAQFYEKWLYDILSAVREDGFVSYSAPYMGGGGGYAWSSAIAVVPERLFDITGDKRYAEIAFPALIKWIGYCDARSENGLPLRSEERWQLGDWLSPEVCAFNLDLMNACWYCYSVSVAARFAKILGKDSEAKELCAKKEEIAAAINGRFLDRERAVYANGVQGENVLPLYLNIVPNEIKEKLVENVRVGYEQSGYKIDTGIVVTGILFKTLADNGMADVAIKILQRKEYPSYEFLLDGESTLSEHWAKKWPDYKFGPDSEVVKGGGDVSHCHPMFGSVAEFLFSYAGGLDISGLCEGKIVVRTGALKYLSRVETQKNTIFGNVFLKWKKTGGKGILCVSLPSGVRADIIFSDGVGAAKIVCAGACGKAGACDKNGKVITVSGSAKITAEVS